MLGEESLQKSQRTVALQTVCVTLNPGDRLRLSIAAAAWPAIGVNSGSPSIPSGAPTPDHRVVTMTLELGDSELTLIPVSSGRLDNDTIRLP